MTTYTAGPVQMCQTLWRYRDLALQLARKEVVTRYRGSSLGLLGAFVQPLLLLAIYTAVFSVVFVPRVPGGVDPESPYVLSLFAGMVLHAILAEPLTLAPGLIVSQPSLVTKTVFPLEVLSVAAVGSAAFHAGVGFLVLLGAVLVAGTNPGPCLLFLPVVVAPLVLLALGVSWTVSAVGVYVRDVGQFTGVVATMLFFGSPILYPFEAVPEGWRFLLYLNPLTPAVVLVRQVVLQDRVPDLALLGTYALASLVVAWGGYRIFRRLRPGFADVL